MKTFKFGRAEDLGDIYFRSSWERNYARYLNFLIEHKQIQKWEYEQDTFWFPVKRGTRSYTPDFKIFENDGTIVYHELKGYFTSKDNTKLKRMKKYYPDVRVVLIDAAQYRALEEQMQSIIPYWEGGAKRKQPATLEYVLERNRFETCLVTHN